MAGIETTISFKGSEAVQELLRKTLPESAQASVIAGAWKKAARPLVKQARAMYRSLGGSGSLAMATKAYRWRRAGPNHAVVHVGPVRQSPGALARYYAHYGRRASVAEFGSGIRHAHLVEWGANRQKQGQMRGFRVLERAWSATRGQVMADFQRIFAADVDKAIREKRR